jgi:hypothetical protein
MDLSAAESLRPAPCKQQLHLVILYYQLFSVQIFDDNIFAFSSWVSHLTRVLNKKGMQKNENNTEGKKVKKAKK